MKHTAILLISFFTTLLSSAESLSERYITVSNDTDSIRIEAFLIEASKLDMPVDFMSYFAQKFISTPYVSHTLDKYSEERFVVNTSQLDCCTFIETILALTHCAKSGKTSFHEFCDILRKVRYKDGIVSYTKRKHYFSYWAYENERAKFIRSILPTEADSNLVISKSHNINYMSTHVSSYSMLKAHPEWISGIKDMETICSKQTIHYIPKQKLINSKANAQLRRMIHDGDILAIVTNRRGLDYSHLGVASWQKDGLHLINASSIHKKVINEPLLLHTYMLQHPSQMGISVFRAVY